MVLAVREPRRGFLLVIAGFAVAPRRHGAAVRGAAPPRPHVSPVRHPSLTPVEMKLGSRARDPSFPTTSITRAKVDVATAFPPKGEGGSSLQSAERYGHLGSLEGIQDVLSKEYLQGSSTMLTSLSTFQALPGLEG